MRFNLIVTAIVALSSLPLVFAPLAQAQELNPAPAPISAPAPTATSGLVGDIGIGVNIVQPVAKTQSSEATLIPYGNFDVGDFFARVDTFGFKLKPVAYGNIELVTRVVEEGYTPLRTDRGVFDYRKSSVPLGIGTLQITPVGAFFLNVFRDVEASGGNMIDAIYAAEIDHGGFAFYPQAGVEYRSSAYVQYFYGVSPLESSTTGLDTYRPHAAVDPFLGLFIEAKISGHLYLDANLRKTWLDRSITASPLVERHVSNSALLALSYRFE